jgi:hypothetical protein
MNTSVAPDALDQGDTDRARTREDGWFFTSQVAVTAPYIALYNSTAARGSMAPAQARPRRPGLFVAAPGRRASP